MVCCSGWKETQWKELTICEGGVRTPSRHSVCALICPPPKKTRSLYSSAHISTPFRSLGLKSGKRRDVSISTLHRGRMPGTKLALIQKRLLERNTPYCGTNATDNDFHRKSSSCPPRLPTPANGSLPLSPSEAYSRIWTESESFDYSRLLSVCS